MSRLETRRKEKNDSHCWRDLYHVCNTAHRETAFCSPASSLPLTPPAQLDGISCSFDLSLTPLHVVGVVLGPTRSPSGRRPQIFTFRANAGCLQDKPRRGETGRRMRSHESAWASWIQTNPYGSWKVPQPVCYALRKINRGGGGASQSAVEPFFLSCPFRLALRP